MKVVFNNVIDYIFNRFRATFFVLLILFLSYIVIHFRANYIKTYDFPKADRYLEAAKHYYKANELENANSADSIAIELYDQFFHSDKGRLSEALSLRDSILSQTNN